MTPFVVGTFGLTFLLAAMVIYELRRRRQLDRRSHSLRRMLHAADQLESELRTCRNVLKQAHAVISLNPDLPANSEQVAIHAMDAGLRDLLVRRLWIRDHAARASQRELDQAVDAMDDARQRLHPLLDALNQARSDVDSAMREHLTREGQA